MPASGSPVPSSVTVPLIDPPSASAASMPPVFAPCVTATGSADEKLDWLSYHSAIWVPGPHPKNSAWKNSTRYSPLPRPPTLYPPELSVTPKPKKLNEVSSALTQTLASGFPVPSSVTVPLIDPPSASAASIPPVFTPSVTATKSADEKSG